MSENELWTLDLHQLNALCEQQMEKLHHQLLNGKSWEDTAEYRKQLAVYLTVLYKKQNRQHFSNPAENNFREE